ncbi:MAG TPA: DoxX family protein [Alphaproteobacteria bacterium]|nr:DoxX family protein [Alphaproteobacteria bacterium]
MERILGPFSPYLYAVMRIVVGFLFASHGAQKLFGALGGMDGSGASASLFSMMGLAGLIEFCGGVLIMVGWLTGYVAFIASGEMAAAYFMAHHPRGFWPILNDGEPAALYCFIFLYIASRGAVAWGIDSVLKRSASKPI